MTLPFICAARKAGNWAEVLHCYGRAYKLMQGIYSPNSLEITYGINQMTTSWSLSLFYYSVVKQTDRRVNNTVAVAALQRYRYLGNHSKMRKVFEEDINVNSNAGAFSTLLLASYSGMWEKAFEIYQLNPKVRSKRGSKKSIVKCLCLNHKWETALEALRTGYTMDTEPTLIKPIIKSLTNQNLQNNAIRLAAASFATGHSLDIELLEALIKPMNYAGQWEAALRAAHQLRLLSPQITLNRFHCVLFNSIVDSLYRADMYYTKSVIDVVEDILHRLEPKSTELESLRSHNHFRLMTYNEVQTHFFPLVQSLNQIYLKLIKIPSWYRHGFQNIVEIIYSCNSTAVVLDTNFVMQCISKDIPLEHFTASIVKQYPHLSGSALKPIIIPFTTLQELYRLIWDAHNRVRRSVRILLWTRLMAFLRRPDIICIPFSTEFPCSSLSILSRMAYTKVNKSVSTDFNCNPDVRILNLCLTLQHYIRCKELFVTQGSSPAEGIMLFSLLKYHVRRFTNSAKGPATSKFLLCTLDKNLSEASSEAGVICFPYLRR